LRVLALLALLAVQPPIALVQPTPRIYAPIAGVPYGFSADTPQAAARYLSTHPQAGARIFNSANTGSYLEWATPDLPVFADTRFELYSASFYSDVLAIEHGQIDRLSRYRVSRIVVDREQQAALEQALRQDPREWVPVYQDPVSLIFDHTAP